MSTLAIYYIRVFNYEIVSFSSLVRYKIVLMSFIFLVTSRLFFLLTMCGQSVTEKISFVRAGLAQNTNERLSCMGKIAKDTKLERKTTICSLMSSVHITVAIFGSFFPSYVHVVY